MLFALCFLNVPTAEQRERSRFFARFRRLETRYTTVLAAAIRHRGRVFAATGVLLGLALLAWPLIPVELAPRTEADEIDIELEMARGTNIAVARTYLDELERKVRGILPDGDVKIASTEVRGDSAAVELKLEARDRRSMGSTEMADRVRRAVDGQIPGAEIDVEAQQGLWMLNRVFSSGGGSAVEIELRGWDLTRADRIAADIRRRMERVPGVTDVRVSREGEPRDGCSSTASASPSSVSRFARSVGPCSPTSAVSRPGDSARAATSSPSLSGSGRRIVSTPRTSTPSCRAPRGARPSPCRPSSRASAAAGRSRSSGSTGSG